MNATKTRRLVPAAAALLLAVPPLSSCATTNFDAQTDQYYTPGDGENERSGTVDVLHALIVSEEPGSGRLIAALSNAGTDGDPVGAESDDSPQESGSQGAQDETLTGVRGVDESEGVQFSLVEGETTIPAGGTLQLADEGSAVISVSGDPELLAPGKYVRLVFTFESGEEAELNVPVLEPGEDYADIEIPEAPAEGTTEPADSEG